MLNDHWKLSVVRLLMLSAMAGALLSQRAQAADEVGVQRYPSQKAGTSAAVRVTNAQLVHTTQLLPPDTLDSSAQSQIAGLLARLDRVLAEFESAPADVVKLHLYVRDGQVREAFLDEFAEWSDGSPPAVAAIATTLPDPEALVGLDAIFVSRHEETLPLPNRVAIPGVDDDRPQSEACVLPRGDAIYISGQAEKGDFADAVRATLVGLERTLKELQLGKQHIVQIKCYFAPMKEAATVDEVMAEFFGDQAVPPLSLVEWTAAPWPIEIDLVAWAPVEAADETVTFSTPGWMTTSPVYSKVARVHGNDRIYVAGIEAGQTGSGPEQVHSVFGQLRSVVEQAGSDMQHLVKATYYVADDEVSAALNAIRPEYYDPDRPPAASKAMVSDVGVKDRSLTLDMIAVPLPTNTGKD